MWVSPFFLAVAICLFVLEPTPLTFPLVALTPHVAGFSSTSASFSGKTLPKRPWRPVSARAASPRTASTAV